MGIKIVLIFLFLAWLPAHAITPVSFEQVSKVAAATDFTCVPVEAGQVPPFCYFRLVTFFANNSAYPITVCYTAVNGAAPAIETPIRMKLFLPSADLSGPLPYTITQGIVSCP